MTTVKSTLHNWVREHFEKTGRCESCGAADRKTEWASRDHTYTKERADWLELCRSCHQRMDGHPRLGKKHSAETKARMSAVRRAWTHCKRGHPLSGDNLYECRGKRYCRLCRRTAVDRYQERLRREAK